MPRQYIPDPRGKKHKWYDQREIENALSVITEGNSIRSAAQRTGIPYSVLQRYSKKKEEDPNFKVNKLGGQTTLPENVELSLVHNIVKCPEWGYPVTEFDVRMFVELIDLQIEEINADENKIQIEENQSSSSNQPGKMPINVLKNNIDEGTWVAVNYGRKKPKLYFGKITRVIRNGYLYEGSFTRQKSSTFPKLHVFPDVINFCELLIEDVVRIVSPPKYLKRGILQFNVSLNNIIQAMN